MSEALTRHIRWALESSPTGLSIDGILNNLRETTNLPESLINQVPSHLGEFCSYDLFGLQVFKA